MYCRTTRQLLDRVRGFHRQVGDYYSRVARTADGDRVRALLEHLGRHEVRMARCLAQYEDVAAKRVLDAWFEFTPDLPGYECFESVGLTSDMSIADVVRTALWFDDCLIRFLEAMADHTVSGEVKALFRNLASMEEEEKHKVTRASLELAEGHLA